MGRRQGAGGVGRGAGKERWGAGGIRAAYRQDSPAPRFPGRAITLPQLNPQRLLGNDQRSLSKYSHLRRRAARGWGPGGSAPLPASPCPSPPRSRRPRPAPGSHLPSAAPPRPGAPGSALRPARLRSARSGRAQPRSAPLPPARPGPAGLRSARPRWARLGSARPRAVPLPQRTAEPSRAPGPAQPPRGGHRRGGEGGPGPAPPAPAPCPAPRSARGVGGSPGAAAPSSHPESGGVPRVPAAPRRGAWEPLGLGDGGRKSPLSLSEVLGETKGRGIDPGVTSAQGCDPAMCPPHSPGPAQPTGIMAMGCS